MKIYLKSVFYGLFVLTMSSCATVFVRSESCGNPTSAYPATKFDAEAFWDLSVKGIPPLAMADPNLKNSPAARLAYGAGAVIDLPFSVVTDTILLPSDLTQMRRAAGQRDTSERLPEIVPSPDKKHINVKVPKFRNSR